MSLEQNSVLEEGKCANSCAHDYKYLVYKSILLHILHIFTQSQHNMLVYVHYSCASLVVTQNLFILQDRNFTTVTGSPAITGSFWMVTDRGPDLNSK